MIDFWKSPGYAGCGTMQEQPDDTFSGVIKDKVCNWLQQIAWSWKDVPPSDQASWAIVGIDPNERKVVIWQVKGQTDHLVLEGTVIPEDQQVRRLNAQPAAERDSFLWDLRIGLLELGLDFVLLMPLERVMITQSVYVDGGLIKDTFVQRLDAVKRGVAWLQFMFARQFP